MGTVLEKSDLGTSSPGEGVTKSCGGELCHFIKKKSGYEFSLRKTFSISSLQTLLKKTFIDFISEFRVWVLEKIVIRFDLLLLFLLSCHSILINTCMLPYTIISYSFIGIWLLSLWYMYNKSIRDEIRMYKIHRYESINVQCVLVMSFDLNIKCILCCRVEITGYHIRPKRPKCF